MNLVRAVATGRIIYCFLLNSPITSCTKSPYYRPFFLCFNVVADKVHFGRRRTGPDGYVVPGCHALACKVYFILLLLFCFTVLRCSNNIMTKISDIGVLY